jgi:hypothetical protein
VEFAKVKECDHGVCTIRVTVDRFFEEGSNCAFHKLWGSTEYFELTLMRVCP